MKRILILSMLVLALLSCVLAEAAPSLLPFNPWWTAAEVRDLIAAGADVNAESREGFTPLIDAVAHPWANLEVVKVLVAAGARVNAKRRRPGTLNVLRYTSITLDYQYTDSSRRQSKCERFRRHDTLMIAAKFNKCPEIITTLITEGAEVNTRDDNG